jgi:adenine-specific DNA-methyltransferase
MEASIFNYLYAFFSRYYQDGDFISKRKYSKRQRYAIPYNGEEVYLYWANHDQYYVKTAEYFHDYTFTSHVVTVHFKLTAANVEQNNIKGDKRFFLPRVKEIALSACGDAQAGWDEKESQLVIPFEYRPLTEQEEIAYGKKNQHEAIIAKTLEDIRKRLLPKNAAPALAALTAEKRKTAEGESVSFLEHHLRQYTKKNTSDFFIHKDLKGFLSRELDFYLKNEVLNLDEIEAAGENRAEGWFQMMRAIKAVGGRIIDFLDQIESFQKMLWEKRKFVTETQYCITVGNIDESFYHDIAACEPQWAEWKELFHADDLPAAPPACAGEPHADRKAAQAGEETNLPARQSSSGGGFNAGKDTRIAFLKANPTLVLDTKHFEIGFVDKLLASMDDLDGKNDGLLIHSENFQALSLLLEKQREEVSCIHIDPPYNTSSSVFLYKNDYRHSSWLCMMAERLEIASRMLPAHEGTCICHIDEAEYERLNMLFQRFNYPYLGTIIWDKRNPMMGGTGIAIQHEYIVWGSKQDTLFIGRNENRKAMLSMAKQIITQHGGVNEGSRSAFADWVKNNPNLSGGERLYNNLEFDGRVYRLVAMTWPNPVRPPDKFFVPLMHPKTCKPCPVPARGWSRTPEKMKELLDADEIEFGPDETTQPQRKVFLTETSGKPISSVLSSGNKGRREIEAMGLLFDYCHPSSLYEELLYGGMNCSSRDVVIDFFAGSGTTGHAVINLNHEDGGNRKFILVEMEKYFDTVLLPRIKKISFTPAWKDGKPKRIATKEEAERNPCIVKYIRLESYEDALNNIEFDDSSAQQALEFDDYLIKYMLKWETRASETLLNVEKLSRPFSYKLHIHADLPAPRPGKPCVYAILCDDDSIYIGHTENLMRRYDEHVHGRAAQHTKRHKPAKLIHYEEFDSLEDSVKREKDLKTGFGRKWLKREYEAGRTRQAGEGRRYLVYRGRIDLPASAGQAGHRKGVIIWRETEGWTREDLERDKKFVAEQKLTEDADEVFVNGDSFIPNARALEPVFKARMFAPVES